LVRRTFAIFLIAEFGFLGVVTVTLVQTPLFWGALWLVVVFFRVLNPDCSAGALDL
jgi:hypothetical protein